MDLEHSQVSQFLQLDLALFSTLAAFQVLWHLLSLTSPLLPPDMVERSPSSKEHISLMLSAQTLLNAHISLYPCPGAAHSGPGL